MFLRRRWEGGPLHDGTIIDGSAYFDPVIEGVSRSYLTEAPVFARELPPFCVKIDRSMESAIAL